MNKPSCKKCGSKTILYRMRMGTLLCRRCGYEWLKMGKRDQKGVICQNS
jgi:ribosomal protein L37AE/L43A